MAGSDEEHVLKEQCSVLLGPKPGPTWSSREQEPTWKEPAGRGRQEIGLQWKTMGLVSQTTVSLATL